MSWHKRQWGELLGALGLAAATIMTAGGAGAAAGAAGTGAGEGLGAAGAGLGAADVAGAGAAGAGAAGLGAGLAGLGEGALGTDAALGASGMGAEGIDAAALSADAAPTAEGLNLAPTMETAADTAAPEMGTLDTSVPKSTSMWNDLMNSAGKYAKTTAEDSGKAMAKQEAMKAITPEQQYTSYTPPIALQAQQDPFAFMRELQARAGQKGGLT